MMGKCSTIKCRAKALSRKALDGITAAYSTCDRGSIRESQSSGFMKRARCTETFRCAMQSSSFIETCTRKNNWGIMAPTCDCRAKSAGQYRVTIAPEPESATVQTVCYQRDGHHSNAWLFPNTHVVTGNTIPYGFRTDLSIHDYTLKFTRGRGQAGIKIDASFCRCAQIRGGQITLAEAREVMFEYCRNNGRYGENDNNCRTYAGFVFSRLTGLPVPMTGRHGDGNCPRIPPTPDESAAFLAPYLENGGHQCVPLV